MTPTSESTLVCHNDDYNNICRVEISLRDSHYTIDSVSQSRVQNDHMGCNHLPATIIIIIVVVDVVFGHVMVVNIPPCLVHRTLFCFIRHLFLIFPHPTSHPSVRDGSFYFQVHASHPESPRTKNAAEPKRGPTTESSCRTANERLEAARKKNDRYTRCCWLRCGRCSLVLLCGVAAVPLLLRAFKCMTE